nr:unnamed protein product [Spirometra erinaceieuropaei]
MLLFHSLPSLLSSPTLSRFKFAASHRLTPQKTVEIGAMIRTTLQASLWKRTFCHSISTVTWKQSLQ